MQIIRAIVRFFDPVQDIKHPFTYTPPPVKKQEEDKKRQTSAKVKKGNWGKIKDVEQIYMTDDGNADASWELLRADSDAEHQELPPMPLDDFDKEVIRETGVDIVGFRKMKPYVLAGWTYPEMTKVIPYKTRWLQERGPKVKEAQRRREAAGKATPPLQEKRT